MTTSMNEEIPDRGLYNADLTLDRQRRVRTSGRPNAERRRLLLPRKEWADLQVPPLSIPDTKFAIAVRSHF